MPFARHSGYTFSAVSVRQNAPSGPGVYGLSNGREWVFVGTSDNIQAALMGHLREIDTALRARGVSGFTFEQCQPEAMGERRNRLIAELEPVCNQPAAHSNFQA